MSRIFTTNEMASNRIGPDIWFSRKKGNIKKKDEKKLIQQCPIHTKQEQKKQQQHECKNLKKKLC